MLVSAFSFLVSGLSPFLETIYHALFHCCHSLQLKYYLQFQTNKTFSSFLNISSIFLWNMTPGGAGPNCSNV